MRAIVLATCAALVLSAAPLLGQSSTPRFYFGASTAADAGSRGPIPGGAVPSAGGLVGIRITDAWSVEVELDRGFRTTERTAEAIWISYAPANSTRQEIERLGIRARFDRTQRAGAGFAVNVLWRSREAGRVNVGLFGGITARAFDSRVVRTTLFVPPEASLPPEHPDLQSSDETRNMTGGGYGGGLLILIAVTPTLTVAPELRYTHGLITDDPYRVFRAGVRVMWGF
jgi:hypothetical protein